MLSLHPGAGTRLHLSSDDSDNNCLEPFSEPWGTEIMANQNTPVTDTGFCLFTNTGIWIQSLVLARQALLPLHQQVLFNYSYILFPAPCSFVCLNI
jgi:hypothetical protein